MTAIRGRRWFGFMAGEVYSDERMAGNLALSFGHEATLWLELAQECASHTPYPAPNLELTLLSRCVREFAFGCTTYLSANLCCRDSCWRRVELNRNTAACFSTHTIWNSSASQFRPSVFSRLEGPRQSAFWEQSCAGLDLDPEAGCQLARTGPCTRRVRRRLFDS